MVRWCNVGARNAGVAMSENDRRLFIGNNYGTAGEEIAFLSTRNFNEANIIFLTYPSAAAEFYKSGQAVTWLTFSRLTARLAELSDWISRGHTLVVFGAFSVPFTHVNKQNNLATNTRLEDISPFDQVSFVAASGSRVEYCGPVAAQEVFGDVVECLRYENLLDSKSIVPLLRVAAASSAASLQVVGAYRKIGLGLVVYLPSPSGSADQTKAYFDQLALLPKLLRAPPAQLPDWVNLYQSKLEVTSAEKIATLEKDVAELKSRIDAERDVMETHKALKALLAGTGAAFANAVAGALRELGLVVVDGPHPRADLLSAYRNRFIAVEAKGIDGAVRETQFRQTERWVAEVNSAIGLSAEEVKVDPDLSRYASELARLHLPFNELSDDCKGLLIVGTFRSTPLAERNLPDFPEPVTRLLNRSKVCGLTGAQLYSLVMEIRDNPSVKSDIVDEIMNTCGVLNRGQDWSKYLALSGSTG